MQTPKRKRYQKDAAPADDIITLIHLVRQNPALYNYKLQPNQRRRIDVLNGWANIAAQIGNKYTVEECRRKWKNLRDTYHQYRLRKPKLGDGLAKWRYAKDLEFLSNVYQPKLKSHRRTHFDNTHPHLQDTSTVTGSSHDPNRTASSSSSIVHHGLIVNDDEAFILTTYEDGDDVATIDGRHEDPNMSQMELSHHDNDVEDVEEIVKHEHDPSLDDDGATGAEVDYEEVCMYEEAAGNVDCETTTIIGTSATHGVGRSASTDSSKGVFQYIDTHDFCIESINPATHTPLSSTSTTTTSVIGSSTKLKNVSLAGTNPTSLLSSTPAPAFSATSTATIASSIVQMQAPISAMQTRDELDLFFEFLKKKMQLFPKEEITAMQVEFLNCVMRREALSANAHKNGNSLAQ